MPEHPFSEVDDKQEGGKPAFFPSDTDDATDGCPDNNLAENSRKGLAPGSMGITECLPYTGHKRIQPHNFMRLI